MSTINTALKNYNAAKARMIKTNRNSRANPNSNTLNAEAMNASNAFMNASAKLRKAREAKKNALQIAQEKYNAAKARMIKANRNYRANPNSNTLNAEAMNASNAFMNAAAKLKKARETKPDGLKLIIKLFKSYHPKKRATEANKIRFWVAEVSAADKKLFLKGIRNAAEFKKVYPQCM